MQTGCMLGEWSDELGNNNYINEWISTGPKSYAYNTKNKNVVVKIKGFTLNWKNSQKLNIASMRALLNGDEENIKIEYIQIARDVNTKQLVNKSITKKFNLDYDKRIILDEINGIIDTLPWGY